MKLNTPSNAVCLLMYQPRLLQLAIPLVFQALSSMFLVIISTIFVGHLNNPVELSGVVLAASLYNVSGFSLVIGLASAMETLAGQVGL